MHVAFPHLEIVPSDRLHPHEDHDPARARPLAQRIREMGVFRDPPIVMPIPHRPGHYMVLDGANRTFACKFLGLPHVLVQIVEPDSPSYRLSSWNHVLWHWPRGDLLDHIARLLPWEPVRASGTEALEALEEKQALLAVAVPPDAYYVFMAPEMEPERRVHHLRQVVDLYLHTARVERTGLFKVEELQTWFPQWQGLVVFPAFTVHEIFRVVERGLLFPAGITRFMIFPRALRLYYPLDVLASQASLEEKNAHLRAWLREQLQNKRVRYYGDTVMLFDE